MKKTLFSVIAVLFFMAANAQTNFYSKATGNVNDLASWGTALNGTGTAPANFTADNQIFNVTNGSVLTNSAAWTVSGAGSKVVVKNGGTIAKLQSATAAINNQIFNFDLDLEANGVIKLCGTAPANAIRPGVFDSLSTVEIYGSTSASFKPTWNYGNLTFNAATSANPGLNAANQGISLIVRNNLTVQQNIVYLHPTTALLPPADLNVSPRIGSIIVNGAATVYGAGGTASQGNLDLKVEKNIILNGTSRFYLSGSTNTVKCTLNVNKVLVTGGAYFYETINTSTGTCNMTVNDSIIVNGPTARFSGTDYTSTTTSPILNVNNIHVENGFFALSIDNSAGVGNTICNVTGNITKSTIGKVYGYFDDTDVARTDFTGKFVFKTPASGVATSFLLMNKGINNNVDGQVNIEVEAKRKLVLLGSIALGTNRTFTLRKNSILETNGFDILNVDATTSGTIFISDTSTMNFKNVLGITSGSPTQPATGNIQTATRTFNASANYIYEGTALQNSGNALPASPKRLVISGPTQFTFGRPVAMNDTLTVTGNTILRASNSAIGVLTDSLTIGTAAVVTGINATSYVAGRLAKAFPAVAAQTYLFHIGNVLPSASYTPVTISPLVATATTYSARMINRNATAATMAITAKGAGVGNVCDTFYLNINRVAGVGNFDMVMTYNHLAPRLDNEAGLSLVVWNGTMWIKQATATQNTTNHTFSLANAAPGFYTVAGNVGSGNFGELAPPTANFTVNKTTILRGQKVTYTGTPAGATTYAWVFTDGTPATSANRIDSVSYSTLGLKTAKFTVTNTQGMDDTTKMLVTVINAKPVANNDVVTTNEDSTVVINAKANDTDADSMAAPTISQLTPAKNGVVTPISGNFQYMPNANFFGKDTFSYTYTDADGGIDTGFVYITINAVVDAPVVNSVKAGDATISGTSVEPDGTLIIIKINGVAVDTLTLIGGVFSGPLPVTMAGDSIEVTAKNANGTSKPTIIVVAGTNTAPVANNDSFTGDEDASITLNVRTNDTDDKTTTAASISVLTMPKNGMLVLNANGSGTYLPTTNYCGKDTFKYEIKDAEGLKDTAFGYITVNCINDVPTPSDDNFTCANGDTFVLSSNDSDVDGDLLEYTIFTMPKNGQATLTTNGVLTYKRNTDFVGNDTVIYSVCDNGTPNLCETANAIIAVQAGCIELGIFNKVAKNTLSVYPNPASSILNFEKELNNANLVIYNNVGAVVLNIQNFNGTNFDISSLNDGMYQMQIITTKGIANANFNVIK